MAPWSTRKSIQLPTCLIETRNERTYAPQMREIKSLKPVEARVFEVLAYFIGKNPLKRIAEHLFMRQRLGSRYLQTLATRFTTLLEED